MDDAQKLRYSRQIMLPQVGIEGQERLNQSTVLIVGIGGLGSPAALYLTAAGIGHLLLCDHDIVELANLQRQIIYTTDMVGKPKVNAASTTLGILNHGIKVTPLAHRWTADILQSYSINVVLDCSDNLFTRLLINEACVTAKIPVVCGAAIRTEGYVTVFRHDLPDSPCYRCLYGDEQLLSETCSQHGILAPVAGMIGSLQALEAVKLLLGTGDTLVGTWLWVDALNLESYKIKLTKNPQCPVCNHYV